MHTIVSFRLKFHDSKKIHFVLITKLIENRKKVSKNNSKKLKKKQNNRHNCQRHVSDFKMFLMKFC